MVKHSGSHSVELTCCFVLKLVIFESKTVMQSFWCHPFFPDEASRCSDANGYHQKLIQQHETFLKLRSEDEAGDFGGRTESKSRFWENSKIVFM